MAKLFEAAGAQVMPWSCHRLLRVGLSSAGGCGPEAGRRLVEHACLGGCLVTAAALPGEPDAPDASPKACALPSCWPGFGLPEVNKWWRKH
jgi:hypothetical protein